MEAGPTKRVGRSPVVVIGGGNAALCAALAARRAGCDVVVLERATREWRGGNSKYTRNLRCVHDDADEVMTGTYTEDELRQDLSAVTGEGSDPELTDLAIAQSRHAPGWMAANGIRWQPALHGTLQLSRTNRFFLGGGKAMMNSYYDTAQASGVDVRYGASLLDLELDEEHRCTAARVEADGAREWIETKAVVAASGGLEANRAWLSKAWGEGAANFVIRGTPDNDGSLLLRLLHRGARAAGSKLFHCIAVDARSPRYDGGIVTRVDSIPFGVVVNKHGVRFYDEGEDAWPKRYAQWGQLIAGQPDQIAYSIIDSRSQGLFIPPMFPPLTSDSLKDLVGRLGPEPTRTLRTIAEFNEAVDDSRAFDSTHLDGRAAPGLVPARSNWARRIEHSPFYGYPLRPGLTFTYAGLEVDETARVVRTDGGRFANVFAAGETMAGNILTHGYLAGVGLTIGCVFGRIAGTEAAHA